MKATSYILYSSTSQLTDEHQPVFTPDGQPLFVRVETSDLNVGGALDEAKPMKGEILLNTIPAA